MGFMGFMGNWWSIFLYLGQAVAVEFWMWIGNLWRRQEEPFDVALQFRVDYSLLRLRKYNGST